MSKVFTFFLLFACTPFAACLSQEDEQKLWCEYSPKEGRAIGKHIVLLAGDEEYRSEEAMPMLGKLLSQRHGFHCTVVFSIGDGGLIDPNNQKNMPGIQSLENADLVIMSLRFRNLPDKQMIHFDNYLKSGKPIIGLRTSTHAFNIPKEAESSYRHYSFNSRDNWIGGFGQEVLGDTWINHHGLHKVQSTRGVINEEHSDHPALRGVKDVWGPTDVYGIRNLKEESATVLLYGAVLDGMDSDDELVDGKQNEPMMPLAWLKEYEHSDGTTNQIMCTTMGSSNDLANEGLRRLIVNSTFLMLDLEDRVFDDLNVEPVGEFQPTMFGFDSWKKGVRPSDHDLDSSNE